MEHVIAWAATGLVLVMGVPMLIRQRFLRRVARLGLALCFGLAVVAAVPLPAHAASPTVPCGSAVSWSIFRTAATPGEAEAAIADAWSAVASVTGVNATYGDVDGVPDGAVGVTWTWRWGGDGLTSWGPGGRDVDLLREGVRVHNHAGSYADPDELSSKALRTMILRDVGRDLGVQLSAKNGKLSKGDVAKLQAACPAGAVATTPAGDDAATAAPVPTVTTTPLPAPAAQAPVHLDEPDALGVSTVATDHGHGIVKMALTVGTVALVLVAAVALLGGMGPVRRFSGAVSSHVPAPWGWLSARLHRKRDDAATEGGAA